MSEIISQYERFLGGIADFPTEGIPSSYAFGRSIDVRTDPKSLTILPRTIKESGNVVTDLVKWGETYTPTLATYLYGNIGNFYKRTSAGSYSFLRQVNASHGNGLQYSAEDDFIYYTSDKVIGRYGPLASPTPTFVDDYFGAQGGVPLNTNSLDLESSSSQYADRADSASLSITSDISISAQIKPESLPTVGNTMTIVSKWNESGTLRSYKFDISAVSGYFGDGSSGPLTISVDTTEAPIDSACSGTNAASSLTATNVSFAPGQVIYIHQTRGTNAGSWMRNTIVGYTAGTISLDTPLNTDYSTSGNDAAQVRVMPQYTNVTVNSGIVYKPKNWNGVVGGILAFIASGTITGTGTISSNGGNSVAASGTNTSAGATGGGFYGGDGLYNDQSYSGEGTVGAPVKQTAANGNGGGGSLGTDSSGGGGGGGGNGIAGNNGGFDTGHSTYAGVGGSSAGTTDLTTMVFGGGGGGGGIKNTTTNERSGGGSGGGIIFLTGAAITITGAVTTNGGNAADAFWDGGGGGGGSILIKAQTATLGTGITANGGTGGGGSVGNKFGGDGGVGRIHLDYYTSYTGTTTPTLDATQDNTLVTNTSYQLRLALSSTGLNSEILAIIFVPQIGAWQQIGVSWLASTSTATFFLNAMAIGTRTGAFTAIHDNASRFAVGANFNGAGTAANFYDGLIDEVQVYDRTQTTQDFIYSSTQQISATTPGLVAYYQFNGDPDDETSNNNDLTLHGTPSYSPDVPFPSPSVRLDIDQAPDPEPTGDTYAVLTAISEAPTDRLTFTPTKDPQKSIAVNVATVGTGDWTLIVHDSNNYLVDSKTITNANMTTGYVEFIFDNTWSPLTNFTNEYHFHLISTVADGTVVTGTNNDLETVAYYTYFQFLVTDEAWHPIEQFLDFLVFGNGRYIATYEAPLYNPNTIILEPDWKVRCFGFWQEYLAVGVMRGTNIYDFDEGRIYFWDGIAPTFNYFIDVPQGGINALLGTKGKLYVWAGYQGDMLVYEGGSTANPIKRMPLMTANNYMEVYPGAVTSWKKLIRFGSTGASDSTQLQKGIYTWGSTNLNYPEILTYDYPISTGTLTGTTTNIGWTSPVNQQLLISWQDGTGFGVDYVNASNAPYPTATIEFLVEDLQKTWKEKALTVLASDFLVLTTGQTVQLKYQVDQNGTWIPNPDAGVEGDLVTRFDIGGTTYHRFQVGLDLTTSTSLAPTITSVAISSDPEAGSNVIG